ncbi:anti-virulence regulator CigR family protein [Halomonas sp. 3H]|uniref:anti-virulence regulator CigR family protein n=1 Tax=Halomonas sp. 3H TaxID=2952527 RepID=UPI0020B841A0|nr:anti-virulence regulator CigR family protein [Halomonas sp. 3H]
MSKRIDLRLAMAASSLALLLAAGPALAQPADNPGRGQGASQGQGQGERKVPPGQQKQAQEERQQGQQAQPGRGADRGREEAREPETWRERDRESWRERERRDDGYRNGPRIDERELRRIFGERRDWVREDDRAGLPPGIRMNLERGKPLPPGIAKRFDDRTLRDLPRYDGYEWRRVGPDAVLVDIANDIVYEVLRDVLY